MGVNGGEMDAEGRGEHWVLVGIEVVIRRAEGKRWVEGEESNGQQERRGGRGNQDPRRWRWS